MSKCTSYPNCRPAPASAPGNMHTHPVLGQRGQGSGFCVLAVNALHGRYSLFGVPIPDSGRSAPAPAPVASPAPAPARLKLGSGSAPFNDGTLSSLAGVGPGVPPASTPDLGRLPPAPGASLSADALVVT